MRLLAALLRVLAAPLRLLAAWLRAMRCSPVHDDTLPFSRLGASRSFVSPARAASAAAASAAAAALPGGLVVGATSRLAVYLPHQTRVDPLRFVVPVFPLGQPPLLLGHLLQLAAARSLARRRWWQPPLARHALRPLSVDRLVAVAARETDAGRLALCGAVDLTEAPDWVQLSGRRRLGAFHAPFRRIRVPEALEMLQRIWWEVALILAGACLCGCVFRIELEASRLLGGDAAELLAKEVAPLLGEVLQLGAFADLLADPRRRATWRGR